MWTKIKLIKCCSREPTVCFDDKYFETETGLIYTIECKKCKKIAEGSSYLETAAQWNSLFNERVN